jgi:hypothetical protein
MINNIVKWLIEQNTKFSTTGFGIDVDTEAGVLLKSICEKTGLEIITFDIGYYTKKIFFDDLRASNKLYVSHYNLIELKINRPWPRFHFIGDLFPFGNMLPTDIDKLLGKQINETPEEWVWNLHTNQVKYKGILDLEDPSQNLFWYAFSKDQKKIIAQVHQQIRKTEVKAVHEKLVF